MSLTFVTIINLYNSGIQNNFFLNLVIGKVFKIKVVYILYQEKFTLKNSFVKQYIAF